MSKLLLSRRERQRQLERAFAALYRWYVAHSQKQRNWNPDVSFNWRTFRTDHSTDVVTVIEGFFAVEQYAPDYTSRIVAILRRSQGRSSFQLRWGAEEERHASTWENALLFSRQRSPAWITEYKNALRERELTLPWEDPLHLLVYTVFQERATQLNYSNLAAVARDGTSAERDPVLVKIASTLAADEAAHYAFFLEGLRLYLYYFPEEALQAILDVITRFAMPAHNIIPNWAEVAEAIYRTGIYGTRDFGHNVLAVVFQSIGIRSRRALEAGLKASREVPDAEGRRRGTAFWQSFNPALVLIGVKRMHERVNKHERRTSRHDIDPLVFVENPDWFL